MTRFLAAATACALLAACEAQPPVNQAQDAGNLAGSAVPAATAGNAAATLGEPVDAARAKVVMHDRHEKMEEIGDSMKAIGRELKGESPDLASVRKNADVIATLAPQVKGWFPPGSGPDVGKTEAKAEIWAKPDDFLAKSRSFEQSAAAFKAAAQGTDLAAIRAAQGGLGKSCKACHDLYREDH